MIGKQTDSNAISRSDFDSLTFFMWNWFWVVVTHRPPSLGSQKFLCQIFTPILIICLMSFTCRALIKKKKKKKGKLMILSRIFSTWWHYLLQHVPIVLHTLSNPLLSALPRIYGKWIHFNDPIPVLQLEAFDLLDVFAYHWML